MKLERLMRNFFKPNNSDGGQNPSRRNSEQTNLSENIATIRRTGVNTMTARKSIYTITAAISVALIATVALVSIGIVGGQSAPNNLSNLDHHLPSCSGADDSITCTTGRIYAVNQLSGLTSESVATGTNLDYQTPEASGVATDRTYVAEPTPMLSPRRGGNLSFVGDDNSLYATYRQENTGATGEQRWANVIREDADTVVVVVEDDDLVQNE